MVNVWRLLSLRSDVDNVILELLGQFSLEKVYADSDSETYQSLVATLLVQLNAVFYIQRMSLSSQDAQMGWYLGLLASWEVVIRAVEFIAETLVASREQLWNASLIREKYVPEALLSMLRVLALHPKAPARSKERRSRFVRVHKSLERVYEILPGSRSQLLLICRDVTARMSTDPDALDLPAELKFKLPNLATKLSVATIVPPENESGDWLPQFLALRDVSHFLIGASIQYVVYRETRADVRLLTSSAKTRNALLRAVENMRLPPQLLKEEMIASLAYNLRMILPDTVTLPQAEASIYQIDENELEALDTLCTQLEGRQATQRISDREVMHNISEVTRKIALLDDPTGHDGGASPTLWVTNCQNCHIAGGSQLRASAGFKIPPLPDDPKFTPLLTGLHPIQRPAQEVPLSPVPFSPDTIGPPGGFIFPSNQAPISDTAESSRADLVSSTAPLEKRRTKWRPKLTISRKETTGPSGDSSSLSSSTLESQKVDEVGLDDLLRASKPAPRSKFARNIHGPETKGLLNCPSVETISFSNNGSVLLASTRNAKTGVIHAFVSSFPFLEWQELTTCRYHVPLLESEDNGVSSAIIRPGNGDDEDLVCISTWTQSGSPILIQPKDGHRTDIGKIQSSKGHGRLGNRIQCACFSGSGKELALVNDKGLVYHVSNLDSTPLQLRKLATSKELTTKSESYAMTYAMISDEETILLAWIDSSKAIAYVKKIPVLPHGDVKLPTTPNSTPFPAHAELSADPPGPKMPAELDVTELSSVEHTLLGRVPSDSKDFYDE
ncbi:MAG: hypothetical protein Q9227_004444 [Pyrenula ochraceoflavens]